MSTPGLMLDLLALQDQAYGERGVARYVSNHAKALLRRPGAVRRLLLNPAGQLPVRFDPILQTSPLLRWNSTAELQDALRDGPAAFYVMSPFDTNPAVFATRLPARVPLIVTLYDLIPLLQPDLYLGNPRIRTHYMSSLALLRQADLVLAISEASRRDALAHLNLPPERVVSIGAGVDASFMPAPPGTPRPQAPFTAVDLNGPYIISVLGDDPRKNLSALLDAMTRLPDAVGRELSLLVIGNYDAASRQQFHASPAGRTLAQRLIFAGRISDDWLIAFYQHAALHVFPSLYEGFGLPAAEAAACGCPSITSNTSSLPEVLDTPEATFDPRQPAQQAALIARVLTEAPFRKRLVERGLAAAQTLTWDAVAQRTLDAIAQSENLLRRRTRLPPPRQPRLALVGPMPPTLCGIADYNARIARELQQHCRLDVFLSHPDSRPSATLNRSRCYQTRSLRELVDPAFYDAVLYTLGNSEHHLDTIAISQTRPGWLWLHDVRLNDLLFREAHHNRTPEAADAFLRTALRREYGTRTPVLPPPGVPVGLDFLRERDVSCLSDIVRNARGILVHSAHAADLLRSGLPPNARLPPVAILPLAFPDTAAATPRAPGPPWIVAHFGIIGPPKLPELTMRAFAALRTPDVTLAFVGPAWHKYQDELRSFAAALNIAPRVTFTGGISEADYAAWLRRAHVSVQLRARSNGESSAALNDAIAAGLPAITNLASTVDWPDAVVQRVSALPSVTELRDAIEQMLEPDRLARQSAAGVAFAARHTPASVVNTLLETLGFA